MRPGSEYSGAPHRLEADLITDMLDRKAGFSLAWNLEQTARVAGAVRDRLSADSVRLVTELFEAFAQAETADGLAGALALIDRAIVSLAAAVGIEMERMTRDDGWRFLSLGRYIERLLFVATTVGEVAASGEDAAPLAMAARAVRQRHDLSRPLRAPPGVAGRGGPARCATGAIRGRRRFSSPSSPSRCASCRARASRS